MNEPHIPLDLILIVCAIYLGMVGGILLGLWQPKWLMKGLGYLALAGMVLLGFLLYPFRQKQPDLPPCTKNKKTCPVCSRRGL